jgi:serine/threonine protein kinase
MADVATIRCPFCGAPSPAGLTSRQNCERCGKTLSISQEVTEESSEPELPEEREKESGSAKPNSFAMKLGPYRLEKTIGKGGIGFVYEALDTRLKRHVAVKVLEHGDGITDQLIERFRQESRNGARLKHPHIASVHDVGSDGRFDYFTMDLIHGTLLSEWWNQPQVTLKNRVEVLEKVARAIDYAHDEGIVHRDIKPGNIMVDSSGEPQVMDFGMACNIDEGPGIAVSGSLLGTTAYMSPEQLDEKSKKIGPCSDIWSLGVVLYEALVRKNPFEKGGLQQTHYAVVHQNPALPCEVDSTIPKDLQTIVMKCLNKRPEERYQTAEALADDLRSWLNEKPIQVQRDSWISRLLKPFWQPKSISVDDFIEVQEARQKAEAQRIKLEANVETEAKRNWKLALEENFFDANVESRWEIIGSPYEIQNGEIKISGGTPQVLYLRTPMIGDVKIEFECRQEGEHLGDMSCFIGALNLKNRKKACETGCMFQFGGQGNTRTFIERGTLRMAERVESPIIAGEKYRICAEKEGLRLRLSVNDEVIFDLEDPGAFSGSEHSSLGLYGWRTTTYYSNIKIYRLGTSLKADLLDLANRQMEKGHYAAANDLFLEIAGSTGDPERTAHAKRGSKLALIKMELERQFSDVEKRIHSLSPKAVVKMVGEGFKVDISKSNLTDLSPLKGLRITELSCNENCIESLEPLRGMALTYLNCAKNLIKSLDPLKGMPLQFLECTGNQISDLEAVREMPLKTLRITSNQIKDLEPLSNLSLTRLFMNGNKISSLEPLKGRSLITIDIRENPVSSLEPLVGMPLETLYCSRTRVSNLNPLHGMNVRVLFMDETPVTSLAPLNSKALTYLHCSRSSLNSLEPFIEKRPPPLSFFFDTDTLPTSELERAYEKWKTDPKSAMCAKDAAVLLALREKDYVKLRKLASVFQGHHYLFIPQSSSWLEAKEICEKVGGHLATIKGANVMAFVKSMRNLWFDAWIGLSLDDGKLSWVTGEPLDATQALWLNSLDIHQFIQSSASTTYYCFNNIKGWNLASQNSRDILPFCVEWDT